MLPYLRLPGGRSPRTRKSFPLRTRRRTVALQTPHRHHGDLLGLPFGAGSGVGRAQHLIHAPVSGRFRLPIPGRGAVWLARLTGGQEVGGSNPLGPTGKTAGQGPFERMAPPAFRPLVTTGLLPGPAGEVCVDHPQRLTTYTHQTLMGPIQAIVPTLAPYAQPPEVVLGNPELLRMRPTVHHSSNSRP